MRCEEISRWIEPYHDGELDQEQQGLVVGHLRQCAACRAELETFEAELRLFEAYAEETAPQVPPELWQKTYDRLRGSSEERSGGWWRRFRTELGNRPGFRTGFAYGVVAALVAVVGAFVVVRGGLWSGAPGDAGLPQGVISGRQLPPELKNANSIEIALYSVQKAEQEYLKAIEILAGEVEQRRRTLAPEVAGSLEREIKRIDQEIDSSRRAYRARPRDFELAEHLLTAYARKVELLQEYSI